MEHVDTVDLDADLVGLAVFTSVENVAIPMLRRKDIAPAEAQRRAVAALTSLGIGELADRRPTQLSGGQQQRVSIARAIAHQPRILLADEPTGNLDTTSGAAVLDIFERLARDGMTIAMVTHEPSYAARAQREVRLRDGRIVDVIARAGAAAVVPAG